MIYELNLHVNTAIDKKIIFSYDEDSYLHRYAVLVLAVLAQLAEHLTCNHEVFGSIPKDGLEYPLFAAMLLNYIRK